MGKSPVAIVKMWKRGRNEEYHRDGRSELAISDYFFNSSF